MANPTAQVPVTLQQYADNGGYWPLTGANNPYTYYTGQMLGVRSDGYATNMDDAAVLKFLGILVGNHVSVDSSTNGAFRARYNRPYRIIMPLSSGTCSRVSDIGKPVFAVDAGHVSLSPTTYGNIVGYLVDVYGSGAPDALTGDHAVFEPIPMEGAIAPGAGSIDMWDDFIWFISPHWWTSVLTDSGTAAAGDAAGGVVTLTCSDGTVADNDEAYIKSTNEVYLFAANKPIFAEAKVKLTEANVDDANILFGLVSAAGANTIQDDGAGPPANYSGMVAFKVDGGTVWQGEASVGATQQTDTNIGAFSDGAWQTLRIEWWPISATQGTAYFYVDGVLGGTKTITFTGATEMNVVLGAKNGGANNEALLVDYVKVSGVR